MRRKRGGGKNREFKDSEVHPFPKMVCLAFQEQGGRKKEKGYLLKKEGRVTAYAQGRQRSGLPYAKKGGKNGRVFLSGRGNTGQSTLAKKKAGKRGVGRKIKGTMP